MAAAAAANMDDDPALALCKCERQQAAAVAAILTPLLLESQAEVVRETLPAHLFTPFSAHGGGETLSRTVTISDADRVSYDQPKCAHGNRHFPPPVLGRRCTLAPQETFGTLHAWH